MKNIVMILLVFLAFYLMVIALVYFLQERMIFLPQTLPKEYTFQYENFEERYFKMEDGQSLHGLLFKAENSRGLVYYLHGNAGSLEGWGSVAETFTDLEYDVLVLDYRGYGKSCGKIGSEAQLHQDIGTVYKDLTRVYPEERIIVLGHSIGAGMAAKLVAENNPKLLILQAPYYSLPDLARNTPPLNIFPGFLFRYRLETAKYLQQTKVPVVVIHGDEDEVIYYGSSLKLQKEFKPGDTLITLQGYGHNDFLTSERYQREIEGVLEKY